MVSLPAVLNCKVFAATDFLKFHTLPTAGLDGSVMLIFPEVVSPI